MIPGLILSCYIRFKTTKLYASNNMIFFFAFIAFIQSVSWIAFVSNLIIDLLTNLGFILSLKPKFLALTLLCWGNCLADLSASLAMTRKGFGEMAITGSVASAIFCILVGLGLSTLIPLIKLSKNDKNPSVTWSAF